MGSTPTAPTTRMRVLYREDFAWPVGAGTDKVIPDSHYPDDYAGKVIAVKPLSHEFSPADMAGGRAVLSLELSPEEISALSSRELKLGVGGPLPVTFDDRWGEVAVGLRKRFGAEVEDVELGSQLLQELPPEMTKPREHEFDAAVRDATEALPAMVTHSGAGLYEVGPGKTYSTIQSALDQLWTDQGAAIFTASQYIRVFAGTYDESVITNGALNPDEIEGYALIVEGDPADDRENIVIQPASGLSAFTASCDYVLIRHMKAVGGSGSHAVYGTAGCTLLFVNDTTVFGGSGRWCIRGAYSIVVTNCTLVAVLYGIFSSAPRSSLVRNTKITQTGAQAGIGTYNIPVVEGCTFTNLSDAVFTVNLLGPASVRNCTFFNCGTAFNIYSGLLSTMTAINNICKDCTYVWTAAAFPEEANDKLGPEIIIRNNCYHGYTNFAYDGATQKTYAEFIALDRVDAAGDLDATDPLLTNPGAGDFNLQSGSPCIHAGHGSGVTRDVDGNPFDPYHPDIGAVSTGIGPNVAYSD